MVILNGRKLTLWTTQLLIIKYIAFSLANAMSLTHMLMKVSSVQQG